MAALRIYDYFERMDEMMKKSFNPVPNSLKDEFLHKEVEFEGRLVENTARTYHAEKLKHISVSKFVSHGVLQSHNMTIFPDGNYDVPLFGTDIVIFEKMLVVYCDLTPYVKNEEIVKKYLDSMKPLHEKYKNLPDEMPRGREWLEKISSGLGITVTGTNVDCVEDAFKGVTEDFNLFASYINKATPVNEKRKAEIAEGRKKVIALFTEYDPGYGPMKKYFGKEWTDYYFHNVLFAGN